jgi:hypothetical protein
MIDTKAKLSKLVPGDIFHARFPGGQASYICLVETVTEQTIVSRRITTQEHVEFELATGLELPASHEVRCAIDSIAPLPVEIHNVMLGLERKMRLRFEKPNKEEKEAFLFIADFYPARPL